MRAARFEPVEPPGWWEDAPAYRDLVTGRPPFPHRDEAERLEELTTFPAARRRRVSALLAEYQARIGAGPAAVEAARLLARPDALAVTTGQQPGVLTGPLFTVYKAVTAVSLARRESRRLGRPVVPVFWIVSDDHDWEEASRLAVVSGSGEVRRFRLPSPCAGRCLGDVPVPAEAPALVEAVVAAGCGDGPAAPGAREVGAFLAAAAGASASVAEWFARLMARLCGDLGLVLLDPLAPGWREEAEEFWARVLADPVRVEEGLAAGAERLRQAGYPVAFPPGEHAWLFLRVPDGRPGLLWRDGAFSSRRGDRVHDPDELLRLARGGEAELSPGAALRPALRDWLLPTLAHVAGPGEAAYLAQLPELYALLGVGRPLYHPRLSLTLVAPEEAAALEGLGLRPADLLGGERALREALARAGEMAVEEAFAAGRQALAAEHARLVQRLAAAGADVSDLAEGNLGRILAQLDYLEAKARQRWRRRPEAAAIVRLRERLMPGGQPQEKVLNVVPWLCRAGWGLAEGLLRAPLTGVHQVAVWEE